MERSLRRASALLSSLVFGIDAGMVIPIKLEKARSTAWLAKRGAKDRELHVEGTRTWVAENGPNFFNSIYTYTLML
jgi:hypothetical protein